MQGQGIGHTMGWLCRFKVRNNDYFSMRAQVTEGQTTIVA